VPAIVSPLSHCYFDVPYADQPADPAQHERLVRVGLRIYAPVLIEELWSQDELTYFTAKTIDLLR
jgi:hypothetical protein